MNSDAKRILIADDESEIRAIVELLLRGEGYDVISVADGQAALDRAAEDIDLYLLDVNMPRLSGIPAAAQIRRRFDAPSFFSPPIPASRTRSWALPPAPTTISSSPFPM